MNFHNITKDDMLNGDGLRVVLWVSGCPHKCEGCHNPETWDANGGVTFDDKAKLELFEELDKDYISGITFSGGDPLHCSNIGVVHDLVKEIRGKYPKKTIWLYTGFTKNQVMNDYPKFLIAKKCDVLVTGRFVVELADVNYEWAGSTNQEVLRNGKDY